MLGKEGSGGVVCVTISVLCVGWVIVTSSQFVKIEDVLAGVRLLPALALKSAVREIIGADRMFYYGNQRWRLDAAVEVQFVDWVNSPNAGSYTVSAIWAFINIGDLEKIVASGIKHLFKLCC